MLDKRKYFNEEEFMKQLETKMKKWEENKWQVRTKEYEDWLVNILNIHNEITDFEDIYLYKLPDGISKEDVDNIFLLSDYWDYKNPEVICTEFRSNTDEFFKYLAKINDDKEIQIQIRNNFYLFSKVAGLGCYVHIIKKCN